MHQILYSQKIPHSLPMRVSYGMYFVRILEKTDCIVMASHCIWVRSRNCGCLVTWFCYQLIAKPGNKTATVPWPDPYGIGTWRVTSKSSTQWGVKIHIAHRPWASKNASQACWFWVLVLIIYNLYCKMQKYWSQASENFLMCPALGAVKTWPKITWYWMQWLTWNTDKILKLKK